MGKTQIIYIVIIFTLSVILYGQFTTTKHITNENIQLTEQVQALQTDLSTLQTNIITAKQDLTNIRNTLISISQHTNDINTKIQQLPITPTEQDKISNDANEIAQEIFNRVK